MHVNAHGAYISPNCTVADTNDQKLKDISKNCRDETTSTWIEEMQMEERIKQQEYRFLEKMKREGNLVSL